jgi:hypothetical protein
MHITLNISSDAELRAAVKDMIKGQVTSLIREELTSLMLEEITRKIKGMETHRFDRWLQDAMTAAVKEILQREHKVAEWGTDFIKPYVMQRLNSVLLDSKDWNKLVDEMAKEKIKALMK